MRKWLIAFSLLAALLGLAACGGPKADVAEQPHVWEFGNTCVNANGERVLGMNITAFWRTARGGSVIL